MPTEYTSITVRPGLIMRWVSVAIVSLLLLFALIFGGCAAKNSFGRYQARENAKNRVSISEIEIANQEQRIQIAIQKAEIRKQDAIGVREAQDEIAKTLTPLYVQFEMVEAMKQIAVSGQNSSVIFIPAGAAGIPLIADATDGRVGLPRD